MSNSLCPNGVEFDSPLETLLLSLEQVCEEVQSPKEEKVFLSKLLQNRKLQSLLFVYEKTGDLHLQPTYHDASRLANDISNSLEYSTSVDGNELTLLLSKPHLKALLQAHDQVARKDFSPPLPNVPFVVDEDNESIKVIQLIKNREPLGATIKIDEASDAVVVSRIAAGSVADRSGLISIGDELREVNGIRVKGRTPQDILGILEQCKEGTITFKLVPGAPPKAEPSHILRANTSYNPLLDPDIPDKEIGLAFKRGDILYIINQDDPDWWKAQLKKDSKIGFIPSISFQRKRVTSPWKSESLCLEKDFSVDKNLGDSDSVPDYEQVSLLFPSPGIYRPIVLIGAPGVGRSELKQRMLSHDSVHYQTTIPYTSRPAKPWEEEGKDYYFVSREVIENGIQSGQFIEYGEYRGNLYGTCLDTIRSITRSGHVCVLNPHPSALRNLCTSDLKPFVIFIKPPVFEVLKETRNNCNAQSSYDESYSRGFTDEEFQDIINNSRNIDKLYGHRFDYVLVNEELSKSFNELLLIVKSVGTEPQWAPAEWVLS